MTNEMREWVDMVLSMVESSVKATRSCVQSGDIESAFDSILDAECNLNEVNLALPVSDDYLRRC